LAFASSLTIFAAARPQVPKPNLEQYTTIPKRAIAILGRTANDKQMGKLLLATVLMLVAGHHGSGN